MTESTVAWFGVREKYRLLADKPWLISQIRPNKYDQTNRLHVDADIACREDKFPPPTVNSFHMFPVKSSSEAFTCLWLVLDSCAYNYKLRLHQLDTWEIENSKGGFIVEDESKFGTFCICEPFSRCNKTKKPMHCTLSIHLIWKQFLLGKEQ